MAARKDQKRRIKVSPNPAKKGQLVTVKALAEHEMEPGVRMDPVTLIVYPRFILNQFICRYDGTKVFESDWYSGVSANPYLSFNLRAEKSGTIEIEWVDDYNSSTYAVTELLVEDEALKDDGTSSDITG